MEEKQPNELFSDSRLCATIKVVGVGGGGGNAIASMLESQIHGADFLIANTDVQALRDISGATTVQIGSEITKGLGAGADPEKGRQAALEASETLRDSIEGADMLFIAAGMGGGTGTGAAPVIAQIARDLGILTVAVVTKPFEFEGAHRKRIADSTQLDYNELINHIENEAGIFNTSNDKNTNMAFFKSKNSITTLSLMQGIINKSEKYMDYDINQCKDPNIISNLFGDILFCKSFFFKIKLLKILLTFSLILLSILISFNSAIF